MAADNVERIKERLDIVDIVGSKVQLRRAGRNFKGLCPFHQEKTPSFVVFPETQGYHCFGCQKGGDIFTFVMDTENLTFPDALERLAQRAGIQLESRRAANPERDEHRQLLIDLNERAAAYFSSYLWSAEQAAPARELVERRGLDRQTAETFGLGYAPDSWDALKTHLQRTFEASEDLLVEAGLASKADSGRVYDRFRNRLMFPIRDRKGQVIGFGARALGDEMPKYLNSPQTPIFDKSSTLYALDRAFADIRKTRTLVVVEGYMDAIAAHQFGFRNAVASMGTALTEAQVHAIRNYVDKVYVALDSDAAGQLATIRAIDTLREGFATESDVSVDARGMIRAEHSLGAEIRVVMLEGGKDPDEIIRSDPSLWQAALDGAVPLVEYILKTRLTGIEDSPAARATALREIAAPVLREVRDPIIRAEYIALTARLLGYNEGIVEQALKTRRQPAARQPEPARRGPERRPPTDPERILVGLLLTYPLGYAMRVGTLGEINPESLRDARHRAIVATLIEAEWDVAQARAQLDESLLEYAQSLIARTRVREDLSPGMANNEIIQALETLARTRYEEMVRQTKADIAAARESGDAELLQESIMRMAELASDKRRFDPRESPYFHDLRSKAS